MNSIAIVNESTGRVQTFVRADLPVGWAPPSGYIAVPRDQLPEGWQMEEPPPTPVPFDVSRRQLFLALLEFNPALTRAAIRAQLAGNEAALIEFDEPGAFQRAHPLVAQLAANLGLSAAQVDALFIRAAQL